MRLKGGARTGTIVGRTYDVDSTKWQGRTPLFLQVRINNGTDREEIVDVNPRNIKRIK